jgi:hypothetical protein
VVRLKENRMKKNRKLLVATAGLAAVSYVQVACDPKPEPKLAQRDESQLSCESADAASPGVLVPSTSITPSVVMPPPPPLVGVSPSVSKEEDAGVAPDARVLDKAAQKPIRVPSHQPVGNLMAPVMRPRGK